MPHRRRYHPTDFGDRQWNRLLAFALERADSFECAIPYPFVVQDLARVPLWPSALDHLRPALVDRYVTFTRWDNQQEYASQFVRFRLTTDVVRFVRAVGNLNNWLWEHDAPEDPTFHAGDAVLLATNSLDGRIAVFLDEADAAALAVTGVRLIEPLGVSAEPWPTP